MARERQAGAPVGGQRRSRCQRETATQRSRVERGEPRRRRGTGKRQNGQRSLSTTVAEYLDETKLTKKPKTFAAYSTALELLRGVLPQASIWQDVDRKDLLKFAAFLRDEKGQAPRSVYNKFENVMTFLKAQGIRGLVGKNDWPRFVEEEPEVYEKRRTRHAVRKV